MSQLPNPADKPKRSWLARMTILTFGWIFIVLGVLGLFLPILQGILFLAIGGMLLARYANQAYQAMGDPYLLPTIAAVVLGGTHILGGRGTYSGTVAGVVLLTLLSSMLSVMQMQEAGRQIIYGGVIIVMLLVYGRGSKIQG